MWLKRIAVSVLSAVCICTCFSTTASAKTETTYSLVGGVSPLYEIAGSEYSELNIIGTTAECISYASGDNAVKITATQYLQKQGFLWIWSTYDGAEWTKTVYSNVLTMSNTKTGLSGGRYRLKTNFTLTDKNGETETITVYSDEKSV